MKKLIFAAVLAAAVSSPAYATVFAFTYSNTFNTKVENVISSELELRASYRDANADKGFYNGSSSLFISGVFDDDNVETSSLGQSIDVQVSEMLFDSIGLVYKDISPATRLAGAKISLSKDGLFSFSFNLLDVGGVDIYDTTSVTSNLVPRINSGSPYSLSQNGEYGTQKSKLSNLYGRNYRTDAEVGSDDPQGFRRYGALKADSFTTSNRPVLEGGTFTLSSAVPEPTTWAMMIVGFGCVGATIRRRRGIPSVTT